MNAPINQDVTEKQQSTPYIKVDKSFLHQRLIDAGIEKLSAYKFVPREGHPGKFDKVPINTKGYSVSADKKSAHVSPESAIKRANRHKGGLSVPLSLYPDLCCIDLDDCMNENGELQDWAQEAIDECESYAELSPSGNGLHIWVRGVESLKLSKFDRVIDDYKYEFLTGGGHVTLTGRCVNDAPLADCREIVADLHGAKDQGTPSETPNNESELTVEEIKTAAESLKPDLWQRLFVDGDLSKNNDDHSAADFALVCLLREAGADEDQIDEIMSESALYREKWDRDDYRERTIQKADAAVKAAEENEKKKGQHLFDYIVWDKVGDRIYDLRLPPHASGVSRPVFVLDTEYGQVWTENKQGKKRLLNVSKIWMDSNSPLKLTVHGKTYRPGEKRIVTEREEGFSAIQLLNSFHRPQWPETKNTDLLQPFLDLIESHYPVEDERRCLLSWTKYVVSCPSKRPQWSPLHINRHHGTGRGSLYKIFGRLVGEWNCTSPQGGIKDLIDSQYQDVFHEKILINVAEAKDGSSGGQRYRVNDALRGLITEDRMQLNLKYGENGTFNIYAGIKFDSNSHDALIIPQGDRRIFVVESEEKPLPDVFWKRLCNELIPNDDFICQIYNYLMRFEGPEGVNPLGNAPMTERKRQLIALSRDSIDYFFTQIQQDSSIEIVLQADLILKVADLLTGEGDGKKISKVKDIVSATVGKFFQKLMTSSGSKKQVYMGNSRPTLWLAEPQKSKTFRDMPPKKLLPIIEASRLALYTADLRQRISDLQGGPTTQEEAGELKSLRAQLKSFKVMPFEEVSGTVKSMY